MPGSCSRPAGSPDRPRNKIGPRDVFGPTCFYRRSNHVALGLTFLVIGLVLALLGFGGIGGAFIGVAKLLFFIAIAVFVVLLVLGLMAGRGVRNALD